MTAAAIKAVESRSKADFAPSDSSQSGEGDLEVDGTTVVVTGHLCEPKEGREFGFASTSGLEELLQKGCLICEIVDPATLDNSLKTVVLSDDSRYFPSLPTILIENITHKSSSDHLPDGIQSNNFVKSSNNIWEHSIQSSALKLEYSSKETSTVFPNVEGEATFARPLPESDAVNQLLDSENEGTISCDHEKSKNETNTRTFSNLDLDDEQQYVSSDTYELCFTRIDDTSKVICDQRYKTLKKPEKRFSERTTESAEHNSDKEPNGDGDKDFSYVDNAVPLILAENINKISSTETNDFSTESVTITTVPSGVNLHPDETSVCPSRKKGRYKRIFKLAPQFDRPRQIAVGIDEELFQDVNLLIVQEDSTNEETREKNQQTLGCPEPSNDEVVVESSLLDIKPLSCNDSKQLAEKSEDLSNNIVASPVQINPSASYEAPLPTDSQTVTDEKTSQMNTDEKREKTSLDVSSTQPDILHSVNVVVECFQDSSAECVQQINEMKKIKYCKTCDGQDSPNTKSSFLKLPLSLGFALQLVELFGSPGVPLGNYYFEKSTTPIIKAGNLI